MDYHYGLDQRSEWPEGHSAYHAGAEANANPYLYHTRAWQLWDDGWHAAEAGAIESPAKTLAASIALGICLGMVVIMLFFVLPALWLR